MFRLYGDIKGWQLLIITQNENEIIDVLNNYVSKYKRISYLIIKNEKSRDIPYKSIANKQDYYNYLTEFENNEEKNKINIKK